MSFSDNPMPPTEPVDLWGPPTQKSSAVPPSGDTAFEPVEERPSTSRGVMGVIAGIFLAAFLPAIPLLIILTVKVSGQPQLLNDPVAFQKLITDDLASDGPLLFLSILATWCGLLIGVRIGARGFPGGWKSMVSWKFQWKQDLLIAVALTVSLRVVELLVSAAVKSAGVDEKELGNAGFLNELTGVWLPLLVVCAAIGAPIVEEIFFRGLFLGLFLKPRRAQELPIAGVLVTSIVFGFMHAQATLASSVYTITSTAIVGAVLALVFLKTRRLGTVVVSHVLFNVSGVAIALLVGV